MRSDTGLHLGLRIKIESTALMKYVNKTITTTILIIKQAFISFVFLKKTLFKKMYFFVRFFYANFLLNK